MLLIGHEGLAILLGRTLSPFGVVIYLSLNKGPYAIKIRFFGRDWEKIGILVVVPLVNQHYLEDILCIRQP